MESLQSPADTALTLSIIALAVSALAAIFAGWQAWTAHMVRRDERRVHLSLSYGNRSNDPANRGKWFIRNSGKGTVLDVRTVITLANSETRREFSGTFDGLLTAQTTGMLNFSTVPPNPYGHFSGTDQEVRERMTAVAEYSIPGGKRRYKKAVQVPEVE